MKQHPTTHAGGLRIGIDVGGTFTHGVALQPPGTVLVRAKVPTTHTDPRGVAAGVEEVLRLVLAELARLGHAPSAVELVAHSTTQATNALLEGDLSPVQLVALYPPGERGLTARALAARRLDIGGGHSILLDPKLLLPWADVPEQLAANVAADAVDGTQPLRRGGVLPRPALGNDTGAGQDPAPAHPSAPALNVGRRTWDANETEPFAGDPRPVAIVQPLAGRLELREEAVAAQYRSLGRSVVCAASLTEVLGLRARARTAAVNAAMLPTMLATADFTAAAVEAVLPGCPVQVVRSDGGAMTLAEMRRQPVLSLLSGPAAGASAALHLSGLANAVFIEVGGTSTDITLIQDGRVRHRSATVSGQRLLVPALDLRTVAVGGGSMLRADTPLFGPRSAHKAGLPYLFQAVASGLTAKELRWWGDGFGIIDVASHTSTHPILGRVAPFHCDLRSYGQKYLVMEMSDGSLAAITATDWMMITAANLSYVNEQYQLELTPDQYKALCGTTRLTGYPAIVRTGRDRAAQAEFHRTMEQALGRPVPEPAEGAQFLALAHIETMQVVADAIKELARSAGADLSHFRLLAGGGGAPVYMGGIGGMAGVGLSIREADPEAMLGALIPDHAVISAIGAALAVTCVSLSRNVAQPSGADIAALTAEVEARLAAQGAERVSTDYEFDPRRQVLTVTGRGSRPYDQSAEPRSGAQLLELAAVQLGGEAAEVWTGAGEALYAFDAAGAQKPSLRRRKPTARLAIALDNFGRVLWQGRLSAHVPAPPGQLGSALEQALARFTQHTDGGAVLPGLGLLAAGRYIPLDQLGSAELIGEVLRWENLPPDRPACFIVRA